MKLFSAILATAGLAVCGAGDSPGLRKEDPSQRKTKRQGLGNCNPRALEGVWAHMSQGKVDPLSARFPCVYSI